MSGARLLAYHVLELNIFSPKLANRECKKRYEFVPFLASVQNELTSLFEKKNKRRPGDGKHVIC